MEHYKIKIFTSAQQDLRDIVSYLNTLSPETATRYYDLMVREISNLDQFPERCPHPRDLALKAKGYRYLLVKNYYVFYIIKGDTVQIRRILYARRDYRNLL